MSLAVRSTLVGFGLCLVTFAAIAEEKTAIHHAIDRVAPHPRLLMTDHDLLTLKERAATDSDLQRIAAQLIARAGDIKDDPPLRHQLKGPRLLQVSRSCLDRVYTLALAWRWTEENEYADAAIANLRTVCAFPDWNPSHFLDTAEMSHAVAIGYDWLYSYMDEATREEIRQGLIRHGLEPGLGAYTKARPWWIKSAFNWNQVCNSGLLIGALALADSEPDFAKTIVPAAVASLPIALNSYNPDGVWSEGPAYWNYATSYTAYGLAALESALGSHFGLSKTPGLAQTAYFPLLTTGPTGLFLNFADSGQNSRRRPMPTLFWLAGTYGLDDVAGEEHRMLDSAPALPHHLIWYQPRPAAARQELPQDRHFKSSVPVAVSRSAWNDRNALFLGVKGGYNQVNHGHLDLGNFEFDALGNRWARDLGSDNYNLPGYWDKKKGGKRWQYYRLNSRSHNVPLIDGEGQDPAGKAPIVRTGGNEDGAFAIIELDSAYTDKATSVRRGVATIAGRRAALIQDEFSLKSESEVIWAMTTDAAITIKSPTHALLIQNKKTLHVNILDPADGTFAVESAERPEPERSNRGVQRLLAKVSAGPKEISLVVCLRPDWPNTGLAELPEVVSLKQW